MAEPSRIEPWNNVKNQKSQRELNAEWDKLFGPKLIREYEENGIVISVYEAR